jgi:DNA-binding CsgD family transcriptional regulator
MAAGGGGAVTRDRRWWRTVVGYGLLLAAGTLALDWLDYQRWVRARPAELWLALGAALFLGLGLWVGARAAAPRPAPAPGNPQAVAALGITTRELAVLEALAAGASNKEIARRLAVSPNTVKTHVARLYAKLDARRRTDAVARARALGILS